MTEENDSLAWAHVVAEAALARKGLHIVVLDVSALTSFADAFVIATGTSDRHTRSVADGVVECAKQHGNAPLGVEGYEDGEWVLIDLNDVIVHVFQGEARSHYDLERLWADAPSTTYDEDGARDRDAGERGVECSAP
ncbi:MAG: ribosome silencing factor [Myxococcales bacterium]|nr:ribosome silencing factor [Myxococcales bacterium]